MGEGEGGRKPEVSFPQLERGREESQGGRPVSAAPVHMDVKKPLGTSGQSVRACVCACSAGGLT